MNVWVLRGSWALIPTLTGLGFRRRSFIYESSWRGISSRSSLARRAGGELLKSLKGTNWTMSRRATSPQLLVSGESSASRMFMFLKSAVPMPTITMERGRSLFFTISSMVASISSITPSVRINRMEYFCCSWVQWVMDCATVRRI